MPETFLKISYDGQIQIIEFDNPKKKNAWTLDTYDALRAALSDGVKNDNVKMTVLTGRGSYYSSGNLFGVQNKKGSDEPVSIEDAVQVTKDFIDQLIDYPKLLVAVVNGPAIGIACTTLALCDAVYACENAWFQTPFVNWGLTAEGCSSYLFPRIMGHSKASKMLYFSEKMLAGEALKCNFVTEVYKPGAENLLWTKLRSYSSYPLGSWLGIKKLLRSELCEKLHQVNNKEIEILIERFNSDDFSNAMIKFMSRGKNKSKL